MATVQDFTTRTRDEIYSIYTVYQALKKRIDDLSDEVTANGGAAGIYGPGGANFPEQNDGFEFADMAAAFQAVVALIGEPTQQQKNAIIVCRR